MANIVVVRDEGGIVSVEVRPGDRRKEAWQIISSIKDGVAIARGKTDPLIAENFNLAMRQDAADEVMKSTRLTDAQKEEFYSLLSGRLLHVDYYTSEYIPGEFNRRTKAVDGGGVPTYPTGFKFVDP